MTHAAPPTRAVSTPYRFVRTHAHMHLTILEHDDELIVRRNPWLATLGIVAVSALLILSAPLLIGLNEAYGAGTFLHRVRRQGGLDVLLMLSMYSLVCALGVAMLLQARLRLELRFALQAGRCECVGWDVFGRRRSQRSVTFATPRAVQVRHWSGKGLFRRTGLTLIDMDGREHAITDEEFALPQWTGETHRLHERVRRYLGLDATVGRTRAGMSIAAARAAAAKATKTAAVAPEPTPEPIPIREKKVRRSERIRRERERVRAERERRRARAANGHHDDHDRVPTPPRSRPSQRPPAAPAREPEPREPVRAAAAPPSVGTRIAGALFGAFFGLLGVSIARDMFGALTTGALYMGRTRFGSSSTLLLFSDAPFWFSFAVLCRGVLVLLCLGLVCGGLKMMFVGPDDRQARRR